MTATAPARPHCGVASSSPRRGADGAQTRKDMGRLVVGCADGPGIIAAVSQFLADHDANIVESDQATTDPVAGLFFLQMAFHRKDLPAQLGAMTAGLESQMVSQFGVSKWPLNEVGSVR